VRSRVLEGQPDQPGRAYGNRAVDSYYVRGFVTQNKSGRPQIIMALKWERKLDCIESLRTLKCDLQPMPPIESELRMRQIFRPEHRGRLLMTTSAVNRGRFEGGPSREARSLRRFSCRDTGPNRGQKRNPRDSEGAYAEGVCHLSEARPTVRQN
jgi:hypothetical protein